MKSNTVSRKAEPGGATLDTGRFLLFAMERTGSTTLGYVLNCHPSIRCVHEPFNPDCRSPAGDPAPKNLALLESELKRLWGANNGIKHVWLPDGGPFRRGSNLNKRLLCRPGQRVLFLNRRNILRRLVSS